MRSLSWITTAVLLSTAVPGSAHAATQSSGDAGLGGEPSGLTATGFLLGGTLSAGATFGALNAATDIGFGFHGGMRLGWMLDLLAAAVEVTYGSGSDDNSYDGAVTAGPVVNFFFWRTLDDTVRLYALGGAAFGALLERETPEVGPEVSDDTFLATLSLGVGGCYFLHPNFLIGLEVGSRTDFIGADNTGYLSGFFASLTLGFVAGS